MMVIIWPYLVYFSTSIYLPILFYFYRLECIFLYLYHIMILLTAVIMYTVIILLIFKRINQQIIDTIDLF